MARQRYQKKRKIRRRDFYGPFEVDLGEAVILDTIEEVETLVRIVGNIMWVRKLATSLEGMVRMSIRLHPGGVDLLTDSVPDVEREREGRHANQILWSGCSHIMRQYDMWNFDIDVKGMRKLEEDDIIAFQSFGNMAVLGEGQLDLKLFYKKA